MPDAGVEKPHPRGGSEQPAQAGEESGGTGVRVTQVPEILQSWGNRFCAVEEYKAEDVDESQDNPCTFEAFCQSHCIS